MVPFLFFLLQFNIYKTSVELLHKSSLQRPKYYKPSLSLFQPQKTYTIGDDVIAQTVGATTQYLLYDGLGSTRQLLNSDETTIDDSYSYDAYGVMLGTDDTAAENADTSLLYAGEQYDSDLSQYYLRARYYNPWSGTFNRTDPFAGNNQDPQSLHKYAYCHNNPINAIDPSGMLIGGITGLINAIAIRITHFAMEYGPMIFAGIWAATKITAAMWMASLTTLILQDLGVLPHDEYVAEIAAILGLVLIAELFILSMIPTYLWASSSRPRGINDPRVGKAVQVGNRIHYDRLTDPSKYTHSGGPSQLQNRYPSTQFEFARRGQSGIDVKVVGGQHPSTYSGSRWPANINQADFKPNTPTGNAMKLPLNALRITYEPDTGTINGP